MNRSGFLILMVASIFFFSGCNNCIAPTGEIKEEERTVNEFSSITLNCSADVVIRDRMLSDKNKVVVKAAANVLPLITTAISGGNLKIDMSGCVSGTSAIEVYVYVNEISKVKNDGSGTIKSDNVLKSDRFDIALDGSGAIELKLRANRVNIDHDGSGRIVLAGNTNELEVNLDSSGESELSSMQAEEAEVNLDGSGTVSVFATNAMNLSLDGSGTIIYKGNPKELKTNKDGSGEIREAK